MKLNQTLALVASFTTALQLATAGNITGKVTLKGTPPAEKDITGITDAACAAGHTTPMKTRFYTVGSGGELADTVVMLNGLFTFEAVARAICEEEGIDVVTYERTHRAESFVFARNAAANR